MVLTLLALMLTTAGLDEVSSSLLNKLSLNVSPIERVILL